MLLGPGELRCPKKRMESLFLGTSVVNMWIHGINVLQKLLAVFCILD